MKNKRCPAFGQSWCERSGESWPHSLSLGPRPFCLVSLYLCWVHTDRFALHPSNLFKSLQISSETGCPHVLVQVLAVERIAELQGVPSKKRAHNDFEALRLCEIHKAIANVDPLLEIIPH